MSVLYIYAHNPVSQADRRYSQRLLAPLNLRCLTQVYRQALLVTTSLSSMRPRTMLATMVRLTLEWRYVVTNKLLMTAPFVRLSKTRHLGIAGRLKSISRFSPETLLLLEEIYVL
jgi:hypothetical protein